MCEQDASHDRRECDRPEGDCVTNGNLQDAYSVTGENTHQGDGKSTESRAPDILKFGI